MKRIVFTVGVPVLVAGAGLLMVFGIRESWLALSVILFALIGLFAVWVWRRRAR